MHFINHFSFATILWLCATAAFGGEATYCAPTSELTKYEGEYARKDIWEKLRTAKDWKSMDVVISRNDNIISITIPTSGEFFAATNHWHEGANSPCIKFNKNQLWVADNPLQSEQGETPPMRDAVWMGPFIRVGPAFSENRLYFHQLFGNKCYESLKGESWCFGSGYIQAGHHFYRTELVLDKIEMPDYGFSIFAREDGDKNKRLLVFRRDHDDEWQVFEEKSNFENRLADKSIRKPWQILKARLK